MNNLTVSLLCFLLLTFFSCRSIKDFQSESQAPKVIKEYLEIKTQYEEDFLSNGLIKDSTDYCPVVSNPYWVVPNGDLENKLNIGQSNNNVSIAIFQEKIYLAFRTGKTHFASKKTGMYIVSSDDGINWEEELSLFYGKDVREPYLIEINGQLHFYYFTAGIKMSAFQPQKIYHCLKDANGNWEGPEEVLTPGEIHWSMKKRNNKVYMTSYRGSHYDLKGASAVSLYFKQTEDGVNFSLSPDSSKVYFGGVSECAFEFDYSGNLWGVTRLEDGDKTGFGSHVVYADKSNLNKWEFPEQADKRCFMSPKLFNHNDEIYLVSRKQKGKKPFGKTNQNRSMKNQRLRNWLGYSLSSKTCALYKINKKERQVKWVMDLPGNGDTGFPSILRLSENKFLMANYSSPLQRRKRRSWLSGQLGKTGIYLILIEFVPCNEE